jgi:hypothetical protein
MNDEEIGVFLSGHHIALGGDYTIARPSPEYIFVNYEFQT